MRKGSTLEELAPHSSHTPPSRDLQRAFSRLIANGELDPMGNVTDKGKTSALISEIWMKGWGRP